MNARARKTGIVSFKFADDGGEGVWVTPEDFQALLSDESLYGNSYVQPITEDPLVTHERIPPPLARKWGHEPAR